MKKAIIVKKNKVQKIVVASDLNKIPLRDGESAHIYPAGTFLRPGDKFEGLINRALRAIGLK